MSDDREHRIRQRAYALWEREGRPEGRQEHHWQQASQEMGDELFQQQGSTNAQERPGALDGGLAPMGGLVAGGGPWGAGIGGRGVDAAEDQRQQQGDTGGIGQQQGHMGSGGGQRDGGLASGLQPGGTIPGASPGVGMGSIGTGGGSTPGRRAAHSDASARSERSGPARALGAGRRIRCRSVPVR